MSMNARVAQLRQQSLDAQATLSTERAELLTEFFEHETSAMSAPQQRAKAFQYLMQRKAICISPGELIVGEKGPAPKATPTYPELCCHSLQDLDILNSRAKVPFKVSSEARKLYEERIIPFWKGKTMREMIFAKMTPEWIRAYDSGFFTEFMEQRAPGHAVLGNRLYQQGLLGYQQEIEASLRKLDFLNDPEAHAKREELKAMLVSIAAMICFAERHADKALELATVESDPQRKQELVRIAEICRHVPGNPPRDFWEALQAYWFVHLGITTELNTWDSFSPGRLDQHLFPFYKQGLAQGTLTTEQATELLQCFWIKFNNQPAPPKVGVTAEESGTYTDFAQISAGGVQEDGTDGVNDVSYLMMDVVQEMRLIQPNASVQISKKTPDRFLKRVARVIRTGIGQPSVFNTEEIIQELVRQGTSVEDARCGGTSGCVETSAFGKENHNLTGYLNMPKILEIALHNGVDPRTGQHIGPETGDPHAFTSFEELFAAYQKQLKHLVEIKICGSNVIERLYAQYMPTPLMSLLVDDCVARGKDYHDGGARYNMSYIQGVGLGSLTDTLTALKYHLFDHKNIRMASLLQTLQNDFQGHEGLRLTLLNKTPKYGNDDDYADDIMKRCFEAYYAAVDGRPNTKGGRYHISLFPTTVHVYFGSVIGATADGRGAWQPLSEGISPVQGADRHGPTAVIRSAAKIDHVRTGGTLLNQKFTPRLLKDDEGLDMLAHLVRSYFTLDGHHIQFNVVDATTLRAAQTNPESYRDLIVRVAGYSDYFCDLGRALQDEIITRTEHESF